MTIRPQNASGFLHETAEFKCGSNTTEQGTGELVPVRWEFSGEKECIFCVGELTKKYKGRYSVDRSVVGEYTLRVENISLNDSGTYKCIDHASAGTEEALADLVVKFRSDSGEF